MGKVLAEFSYLEIAEKLAVKRTAEMVLDNHWKYCRENKVWYSRKDGVKVKFEKMATSHLVNTIGMLRRFEKERASEELSLLKSAMLDEYNSRKEIIFLEDEVHEEDELI